MTVDWVTPVLPHTQFHFFREIPVGRTYEVRTFFGGWDEKRVSGVP